jgi:DNA-binding NtrC family response regulator
MIIMGKPQTQSLTNKNLRDAISAGTFREDLFYRLNVFPILIPPLRERKEDIPLLVEYFVKHYGEKLGKSTTGPSQNDMNRMIAYDWPGNVRELENIVERSVILSRGSRFHLPELYRDGNAGFGKEALSTLAENERRHIIAALKTTGGKVGGKGGAAELLDIHYKTLFSRMKKLGIKKSDILSKSAR